MEAHPVSSGVKITLRTELRGLVTCINHQNPTHRNTYYHDTGSMIWTWTPFTSLYYNFQLLLPVGHECLLMGSQINNVKAKINHFNGFIKHLHCQCMTCINLELTWKEIQLQVKNVVTIATRWNLFPIIILTNCYFSLNAFYNFHCITLFQIEWHGPINPTQNK